MLKWNDVNDFPVPKNDGKMIIIKHNRGTWWHPSDREKVSCVVVFWSESSQQFEQFGPDSFSISSISYWAEFNAPSEAESHVVVTTTEDGEVVLVSRQDEDHKILKVIWEKK